MSTRPLKWWLEVWEPHPTLPGVQKRWFRESFPFEDVARAALPRALRAIENAVPGTRTIHAITRK